MSDERLNQGRDLVTEAWYDAMDNLISLMDSDDPRTSLGAAIAVLDYTSKFSTGLGEPFIPEKRPARSGGEEDEDSDDEEGGDYLLGNG